MNKKRHLPSDRILGRNPEFLTADQVAPLINLSAQTVRSLCRSGELPARKLGKEWRIHRDRIKELFYD